MGTDAGRLAAYADLVAAVLDLRSPSAGEAFDEALAEALASGAITDGLARRLRLLQRQSERAMVEHAESVLPPALVALDHSAADALPWAAEVPPTPTPAEVPPTPPSATDSPEEAPDEEPAPVVNLQARRLLVAGLRTISDSPRRGGYPSVPADPGL